MSFDIDEILPSKKDLDYRIQVNLDKGLSLDYIKKDTKNLLHGVELLELKCKVQKKIYRDLIDRIDEKIKEGA